MSHEYPNDWNTRRKEVYQRDEYMCQNCGAKGGDNGQVEIHAHHVVPKSKGGGHHMDNLKTLCKNCHNAVHGGDSVSKSSYSTSSVLFQFPKLAEIMEYNFGATPSYQACICLNTKSIGILNKIQGLFGKETKNSNLPESIRSKVEKDSINWEISKDDHEYTWININTDTHKQLLSHTCSIAKTVSELPSHHYLLAILFPFELYHREDHILYWIFSNNSTSFYPFALNVSINRNRDSELELKAAKVAEESINVSQELDEWYPMWPSQAGSHPWGSEISED